jgi:drug/metabolite transporter (DMT)-like permease
MSPPPAIADASPTLTYAPPARPATVSRKDGALLGIGLIIASTIFFSAGDVAAKLMMANLPPVEVTWLRYVVFLALIAPAAVAAHGGEALRTRRPKLQVLRGLAVVLSSLFFMLGLGALPVAETTAINFMSPVFITALSIPLLGEKVGVRRWAAAVVGFAGVLVVVRPGSDAFHYAALFPVGAAMVWAFAAIATRMMSQERPETTLAWSAAIGVVVLSVMVPFNWRTPSTMDLVFAVLTGVGSTLGHWLLVQAYRMAPASVLAPFSYVQLVFASVFAFLVFDEVPGSFTVLGGVIIAASGLYTANRERIRAREARAAA